MLERPSLHSSEAELPEGSKRIDALRRSLEELFFIEHPSVHKNSPELGDLLKNYLVTKGAEEKGIWIYYPWLNTAIKIPSEDIYFRLRTARNRNLITTEEQKKYREARVGIAGLSVGSTALNALVATGGPRHVKISDPDVVEVTNLNRIRAALPDIGQNKSDIAARAAWELDPFLQLEIFDQGLQQENLENFMSEPKLDVFIDEMDSIQLKILSRIVCKRLHIPVVMATDNGDGVIVDVERFDLEPDRPIFHGRVNFTEDELQNIGRDRFIALANEIIDPEYFTLRQQQSILAIGQEIAGVPQVATAAAIAGATVAFAVRQIVTSTDLPSGRYVLGCEETFVPNYSSAEEREKRTSHAQKLREAFPH